MKNGKILTVCLTVGMLVHLLQALPKAITSIDFPKMLWERRLIYSNAKKLKSWMCPVAKDINVKKG